jgi:hypothetical protein
LWVQVRKIYNLMGFRQIVPATGHSIEPVFGKLEKELILLRNIDRSKVILNLLLRLILIIVL